MSDLGNIGALGVIITLLAGVTHEAAEHLFGGLVKGRFMYWAVLGTGIAVAFGAQAGAPYVPALDTLNGLSWQAILAGGVVVGFTATKLHGVLSHNLGTETASLSGIVKTVVASVGSKDTPPKVDIEAIVDSMTANLKAEGKSDTEIAYIVAKLRAAGTP